VLILFFIFYLIFGCPFQVLNQTPFLVKHGQGEEVWGKFAEAIATQPQFAAGLSAKKARDKFNFFLKGFKTNQANKKASTGTDNEQVSELDRILQDISDMKDDDEAKKKEVKDRTEDKEKQLVVDGEELRKKAVGELKSTPKDPKPNKESKPKPSVTDTVAEFLTTRAGQRDRELDLQKRRLELEAEELAFKRQQAEKRAKKDDDEREERKFMMRLLMV
jgi:hypothetical protein